MEWGRITNFPSITLYGQIDGYVPYIASKGALPGLLRSPARELGLFGICVNAMVPGAIPEAVALVIGHMAAE